MSTEPKSETKVAALRERMPPDLRSRMPNENACDDDAILDAFLGWVSDRGVSLYAAQEEALLELMAGKHVVLNTPTGSGKSLVATGLLFRALCRGERGVYTFPIKALASEKFFELCELFGAENVGMLTGDASINRDAPIVCATAEILANLSLRDGDAAQADCIVMDEFHYYGDSERGVAWQVPLLTLQHAQFLLMSATLGDVQTVTESLAARTQRQVSVVRSDERPVPLDYSYRETPLHETLRDLFNTGRSPVYVVSFTQRECAEVAQGLTSFELCTKEQKEAIGRAISGFRFDSPFGTDLKRVLRHGIGIHHAGLLPKYRRLIERLAQQGLLTMICGTDTLGVGVNVPIRTVCFTKLCKFDGVDTKRLSVRDFKQIAGRAGRKGFDTAGSVVCQAPEHVIENRVLDAKAAKNPSAKNKQVRKKPPERGYVHWDEGIFKQLIERPPEPLVSQFKLSHGMLLSLMRARANERHGGYGAQLDLINSSHERPVIKARLKRESKTIFKSLRAAAVLEVWPKVHGRGAEVRVSEELQLEFTLHAALSLYLLETLPMVAEQSTNYALDVLSMVEAIAEHPRPVLYAQERKAKDELMAQMKAQGAEYEERMAELERVTYPKPNADFIYGTFNEYVRKHPWLKEDNIRPKSVAREMFERYASFTEYVKHYGIAGSEGVLLRYLSDVYRMLVQSVPTSFYSDDLTDVVAYLRVTLQRVDSSLVQEWESLLLGDDDAAETSAAKPAAYDIARDPKALRTAIRAELHLFVKALADKDYEEALSLLRTDGDEAWSKERFEAALAPYYAEHAHIVFDQSARFADKTLVEEISPRVFRVDQILVDPSGDNTWRVRGEIDLRQQQNAATRDEPWLRLIEIGT